MSGLEGSNSIRALLFAFTQILQLNDEQIRHLEALSGVDLSSPTLQLSEPSGDPSIARLKELAKDPLPTERLRRAVLSLSNTAPDGKLLEVKQMATILLNAAIRLKKCGISSTELSKLILI